MGFSFPACHEEAIGIPATPLDLLIKRACLTLGWDLQATEAMERWVVKVPMSFPSWGECVTIEVVENSKLRVRSSCSWPLQCFDWGKNATNVRRLKLAFEVFSTNGKL